MKKGKDSDRTLTEVELELMTILWRLTEGTVNDVIAQLPNNRRLAYTSVSTILRILEQKGVLQTRKEGRGHIYVPQLKKADYEATTVQNVVERVFDGAPVALVKQLLDHVDERTLREIKELIQNSGGKK